MFEFAWPWIFLLAPLPWLLRAWLPAADSGEAALKISFLAELESLSGRRARVRLPALRQQAPFALIWLLLLLPLSDPLDHALPNAGLLRFTEQGAQLELDTQDPNLRQAYRSLADARQARWQRLAQKLGVPLLALSTQREMIEQLREHLNTQRPRKTS